MEKINLNFLVDGADFMSAGEASGEVKNVMKRLGLPSEVIRRTSIAMYEGEINMVIHANGGEATVEINEDKVKIILKDYGPGIADISKAMQEGYSTAPDNIRALGFGAGMGLPNMKKYTDSLDITSEVGHGTTLTMTILNKG